MFVGLVYCEIPIILFHTRIRKSELGNISKVRNLNQWSMFFEGLFYCEKLETVVHVFVGLVYCEIPIILFHTRIRKSELGNISKVRNLNQWSMFFEGLFYCEKLETVVHVFVGLVYCEIPIILFDTRIRKSELGNISKVRNLKQWSMFW